MTPRSRALMTIAAAFVLASPCLAQSVPNNGLAIFFDQGATMPCSNASPYTTVTAYVIAVKLTEPSGIAGWEAGIFTNPETLPVPLTIDIPDCVAGCTLPYVRVLLASPLARTDAIRLARLSTFYVGGTILFGLGACQPTSFPENPGPGYRPGDGSGRLIRFQPFFCTGPVTQDPAWVAGVNANNCCELAGEETSWGAVKSLYD